MEPYQDEPLLSVVGAAAEGVDWTSESSESEGESEPNKSESYPCTSGGDPIDVTLTAINEVRQPYFNFSVTLRNTEQRELIHLMQEAAEHDGRFNFTASYRRGLGFFVETINGQTGDWAKDRSWWHTYTDEPGTGGHCEGVSAYVPGHKEEVVFLLTNRTLSMSHCPTTKPQ